MEKSTSTLLKRAKKNVAKCFWPICLSNGNFKWQYRRYPVFPNDTWELLGGPGWHLSCGWTDWKKIDSDVNAYFKKTTNCICLIGEYNITKCFEIQFSITSFFALKVKCWNEGKLQVILLWSFVHYIIQLHNMVLWLNMLPSEINRDITMIQLTIGWLHLSHFFHKS